MVAKKLFFAAAAAMLLIVARGAHAQSAGGWYPTQSSGPSQGMTVSNVSYITHAAWNSRARVSVQFSHGLTAYYYFSPSDPVQTEHACMLYSALLSAEIQSIPAYIYVTASDPFTDGAWDFDSVQVGSNVN